MWKVLIVDDHLLNRKLMSVFLKNKAECDYAGSEKEALEAIQIAQQTNLSYDVMLLDIGMPGGSGMNVLKLLRLKEKKLSHEKNSSMPILMVTGDPQMKEKAFELGCDDYILKPVNPDELINKINAVVKGSV